MCYQPKSVGRYSIAYCSSLLSLGKYNGISLLYVLCKNENKFKCSKFQNIVRSKMKLLRIKFTAFNYFCKKNSTPKYAPVKYTHREKAPSNKTPALTKSKNMGIWVVGTTNQLCIRGSETETKFSKK